MSHPMTPWRRCGPSAATRRSPAARCRRARSAGSSAFARPYRRDLSFFLLLVVARRVIGVITPLLAGDIINRIARHGDAAGIVASRW